MTLSDLASIGSLISAALERWKQATTGANAAAG
jgi:hypothetical protein